MLKKLLFLLLLSSPLFAQYTSADFELVRTTFERKFESKIIDKYLSSSYAANVKAALLSLSNAQDTSFIDNIIKPDFTKFGNYIAFALGETGVSAKSENYLLTKIFSNQHPEFQRYCFEALGRCGSKESLDKIIQAYFAEKPGSFDGISIAIANFAQRGIRQQDSSELKVLLSELSGEKLPIKRRIDAAFAASRIGLARKNKNELLRILFENIKGEDAIIFKQYILASLKKIKSSPDAPEQIKALISSNEWRIRTEALKVIMYHKFTSSDELKGFIKLLKDYNPNVSRQMAISLKEINLDSTLMFLFKDELKRKLLDETLTDNTLGELFVTYCKFFPTEMNKLAEDLKERIGLSFIYRALSANLSNPQGNLTFLLKNSPASGTNEHLEIINAVLPLQNLLNGNQQLNNYLFNTLSSDSPAAISVCADGLDSTFIEMNKDELKKIIIRQINLYQDSTNFTESNISLVNLAKRISPELRNAMLSILKKSASYSVQSYAARELGKKINIKKSINSFADIWTKAFKYSNARITTDKGTFVIRFLPEYSPVSVGNFCKLAQSGFYNKVIFHRVVPNFVIQTGDPEGTGWGGPGYDIISEVSPVPFEKSYVGMASAGKDTEGSQWFVMHSLFPHLNGRYSNFGKVIEGMDTVNLIDQGDSVLKVELFK
ncbi:MAG: peptidylprolyl isomerase [Bacillota bacterium]